MITVSLFVVENMLAHFLCYYELYGKERIFITFSVLFYASWSTVHNLRRLDFDYATHKIELLDMPFNSKFIANLLVQPSALKFAQKG